MVLELEIFMSNLENFSCQIISMDDSIKRGGQPTLEPFTVILCSPKEPVKLIPRLKTAHSFVQSMLNLFHFIILSSPM